MNELESIQPEVLRLAETIVELTEVVSKLQTRVDELEILVHHRRPKRA